MSAHFQQGIAVDDRGAPAAIATRLGLDGERVRAALVASGAQSTELFLQALVLLLVLVLVLVHAWSGVGGDQTSQFA